MPKIYEQFILIFAVLNGCHHFWLYGKDFTGIREDLRPGHSTIGHSLLCAILKMVDPAYGSF